MCVRAVISCRMDGTCALGSPRSRLNNVVPYISSGFVELQNTRFRVTNIIAAPFRRGVHPLKRNNFGECDSMTPRSAIVDPDGLALCIYLTKPGTQIQGNQEIHLLRLISPPEDIAKVFHDRPLLLPKFRQFEST